MHLINISEFVTFCISTSPIIVSPIPLEPMNLISKDIVTNSDYKSFDDLVRNRNYTEELACTKNIELKDFINILIQNNHIKKQKDLRYIFYEIIN